MCGPDPVLNAMPGCFVTVQSFKAASELLSLQHEVLRADCQSVRQEQHLPHALLLGWLRSLKPLLPVAQQELPLVTLPAAFMATSFVCKAYELGWQGSTTPQRVLTVAQHTCCRSVPRVFVKGEFPLWPCCGLQQPAMLTK